MGGGVSNEPRSPTRCLETPNYVTNNSHPACVDALNQNGCCLLPQCVGADGLVQIENELTRLPVNGPGRRNLLSDSPFIREFAEETLSGLLRPFGSSKFFPVRALLFDKTAELNWNVNWHQDLSIAVKEQAEVAGFGGWSSKAGVWHVQPPVAILERMITVRLHLDDCGPENAPLRVIPGSHTKGRLSEEANASMRAQMSSTPIHCCAGDALLMRPLLLHASSKAEQPSQRRVLHIEFAAEDLPHGLEWAQSQKVQSVITLVAS